MQELPEIRDARIKLENSRKTLFNAYLNRIEKIYHNSSDSEKTQLLEGLEGIVDGKTEEVSINPNESAGPKLSIKRTPLKKVIKREKHPAKVNMDEGISTRKNAAFDHTIARSLRQEQGLSITQVVDHLGLNASAATYISNWESGKIKPSNPPRSNVSETYLIWLKGLGYDVFNL